MSANDPTSASLPPVAKKEIFGWCCFDFANSAFTTVIVTVVYAPYFVTVVAGGDAQAKGWWGTALSASLVVVLLLSPLLGAVADVLGRKRVIVAAMVLHRKHFPKDYELKDELRGAPEVLIDGGSAIIGPNGEYIVPPVTGREALITADIDTRQAIEEALTLDVGGHYSRPDVFRLVGPAGSDPSSTV